MKTKTKTGKNHEDANAKFKSRGAKQKECNSILREMNLTGVPKCQVNSMRRKMAKEMRFSF